jgi:hypothetical protein
MPQVMWYIKSNFIPTANISSCSDIIGEKFHNYCLCFQNPVSIKKLLWGPLVSSGRGLTIPGFKASVLNCTSNLDVTKIISFQEEEED